MRISLVIVTASISISLPYFADLMALIGAVSNTILIFVLPIACSFILKRDNQSVLFGILILIIGLIGGAVGTYEALVALYHDIINNQIY
jgi:hypothetical protein